MRLLAMVPPTFLPSKLELGENITVYNHQQVLSKFDYNQEIVRVQGDTSFPDTLVAENQFVVEGKDGDILWFKRIFYLRMGRDGVISFGGLFSR